MLYLGWQCVWLRGKGGVVDSGTSTPRLPLIVNSTPPPYKVSNEHKLCSICATHPKQRSAHNINPSQSLLEARLFLANFLLKDPKSPEASIHLSKADGRIEYIY